MASVNFTTNTQTTELIGTTLMKAQNTLDFSANNATAVVCQALSIPAGAYVFRTFVIVTTVEDSTCTFDIGDGDDPNGYDDGVDGEALGTSYGVDCTTSADLTDDAYASGRYYPAADTIDISLDNAADTMVLKVVALYCIVE